MPHFIVGKQCQHQQENSLLISIYLSAASLNERPPGPLDNNSCASGLGCRQEARSQEREGRNGRLLVEEKAVLSSSPVSLGFEYLD